MRNARALKEKDMLYLISLAAAAFVSLSAIGADAAAAPNHTISLDAAVADLQFAQTVENAVAACRIELADDVFANFRLQSCVEAKVTEDVESAGAARLAAFAAAHPDYPLTAIAP